MSKLPSRRIPKCKVYGDKPSELHLSTSRPAKPQFSQPQIPPAQFPPQSEAITTEYVHNLQQQLYVLNAELRFLHDRSGIDEGPEGLSVDASIRRLRIACSCKEEETNKEIQKKEQEISDLKDKIDAIKVQKAIEKLAVADEREREGLENLENAFVEVASELKTKEYQSKHADVANDFIKSLEHSMRDFLESQKQTKSEEEAEYENIKNKVDVLRQQRKEIVTAFQNSIRNKGLYEEETDMVNIMIVEPEKPPPNVPLSTINAKNAKLEMQLKATLTSRDEIEQQVDLLLEKNIELKATLNQVNATVSKARWMKEEMESKYAERYETTRRAYEEKLAEISALKRMRKEMKAEIMKLTNQFNKAIAIKNQKDSEEQMNKELIAFNNQERAKIDDDNEQTKREINAINGQISEMREHLDDLARQIAEAGEKYKSVAVLVEINEQNPMCQAQDPPPELQTLFESLTAVREAIA
ncbi:hypothetical protein TRFO_02961 [Tritrichomonas foetus]|uniref:Uncharacterized protein n=1 Tax=Tritrichomonas foetus TaxID=1144522 RepID=A0A1J4KTV1_9EUKA|nr:hypothetical protein TRFO_02961 [Tritrichomonas foetus]|eukprot:OHT14713.1 hypothetical protein TRFO_02961 [Tritrichomonas foetus]